MPSLLQLPPELRIIIYELVLRTNMIHANEYGNVRGFRFHLCTWKGLGDCSSARGCWAFEPGQKLNANTFALLQACQSTYDDARNIFFALNTFSFNHRDDFDTFKQMINPSQMASIRSVRFQAAFFGYVDLIHHGACTESPSRYQAIPRDLPGLKELSITGPIISLDSRGQPWVADPEATFRDWEVNLLCLSVYKLQSLAVRVDLPAPYWYHYLLHRHHEEILEAEADCEMANAYSERLRRRLLKLE
ncbi:MAG: hypothetical protein M1812_004673 [Candelaria pacifica]|nr:MAG: hypothetical protein M1812_004673 [Candelaria pacifica]